MLPQDGFPKYLLEEPIEDRIAYFKGYTMAHPKLATAAQELMNCIQDAEAAIVFIYGATGVGKSTLLRRVSQKLTEALLAELEVDKGRLPIVGIEAMSPEFRNFDWKDFYLRSLSALKEPSTALNGYATTNTKTKLRMLLEKALQNRRPDVFFIDEAQNLAKVASGRKLLDQTDCLKSLANLSGVQFVLVGTYDLVMLRNLSAQICRRAVDIHFSRYQAENPQDLRIFRSIVQTFQRHLPIAEETDLVSHWDFCYERSLGCVGILKDWLSRSLSSVLRGNTLAPVLTIKDLERNAPSLEKCLVMLREIKEEENRLEGKTTSSELRIALGLDVPVSSKSIQHAQPKRQRKRSDVGKPLPQRRTVGGG